MPDKNCPGGPSGRHFWINERNWPVWIDYSRAARECDCRVRWWPLPEHTGGGLFPMTHRWGARLSVLR
jgi:hypothetical protein